LATVTFVHPGGRRTEVSIESGTSVMEAAVDHGIDEILAECGGSASCATCHVFVAEDQRAKTPPMSALEDDMLDGTAEPRRETSRLACQLVADEALDGLVVELPENQC